MLSFMFWGYFILYSNDFVIFFSYVKTILLGERIQNGSVERA